MSIKHRVLALSVMAATLGISGCAGWSIKGTCSGAGCSVEGEIHGGTQAKLMAGSTYDSQRTSIASSATDLSLIDASNVVIDTAGSSVGIPMSGNVTLKLVDSTSGFLFAARSFGWMRVGSEILLADPASVNAWIQENGAGADDMQFALAPFAVAESPGLNSFATSVRYAGIPQASSTSTWTGSSGSCRLCQVK